MKWEKFFKKRIGIQYTDQFIKGFYKTYKPKNAKILDLGCGNGRNTIFFAKKGLNVFALKYKKEAKYFRDKIIDILTKRKIVILGELAKELDINEDRMYYLLKSLRLNNKIKRLSYGRYALS